MRYEWSVDKNELLIQDRGVGFENVLVALRAGKLLDTIPHPNQKLRPDQRVYVVEIDDYAYLVPFVEDEEKIFLKTIIPNSKATKHYLRSKKK
jgi:hypothetical protein